MLFAKVTASGQQCWLTPLPDAVTGSSGMFFDGFPVNCGGDQNSGAWDTRCHILNI